MLLQEIIQRRQGRRSAFSKGTAIVEAALVLPIFILFLLALLEFGRVFMVVNVLKSAARTAARRAVARESTNAEVEQIIRQMVGTVTDASPTIFIKNASSLDAANSTIPGNFGSLPNYTLDDADESDSSVAGDLFLVRVEIPYRDVAFFGWIDTTLSGQALMRRE
jgi:Flp pilus assembly protein TadG